MKNKLRTLYKGSKKDNLINRIASTFAALCEYADFSSPRRFKAPKETVETKQEPKKDEESRDKSQTTIPNRHGSLSLDSLQYHINIVLPESRDQAVYDAIFKSLRHHTRNQE